ncbi:ligand-binding sensor domain-containing protein/signal transduction histidine kinase [Pedobacter sp. CG_S7]|uniref:sensor histidine kinase n=1 Tax=Pedobacter sp. CG_S7 TaxID=3143930 RepID=UPI0033921D70
MLQAQPYYFKHYQVENGLSNNSVFANVQDQSGFMWFGTKDGLNRFDGYSFKTYRHDPANPGSIGSDKIHALLSDKIAGFWVGTDKGLYKFNQVKETFTPVKETLDMAINNMLIDQEGNIWILSWGKVFTYNTSRKIFSIVHLEDLFIATSIYCRQNGEILITSNDATIAIYNKLSKSFETLYWLDKKNKGNVGMVSTIIETNDQQLLIGTTNNGIKLFNMKTKVIKDIITQNKDKTNIFVRDMQAFNDQEYWFGTESGLYIYNHINGKITHLEKQYSDPYTLSDNAIYALCKDKDGGIWMGTYFGGINYYSTQSSVFTKFFPQQNSISGSAVREICKDKNGTFWIGTEDAGLNKMDSKTGNFIALYPNGTKYSIAHSNIHGLLADGNKLWISTFEHGIDIMDINTNIIKKHYQAGKGNSLRSNFVLNLHKTKGGEILVATTSGLYLYNRKKDDFDAIPNLPFYFFNNILEDSDGTIWAGTYGNGLFSFRLREGTYKHYNYNEKDKSSLANNTVNCIFEDSRKNIWVATDGGGFSLFNKEKSTFKSFTVKNGLPSNFVFRIEEDNDYKLWLSSTKGLIRFDPKDKTVKVYTKADGLLSDQFNYNSSFRDTDGRMFFGSLNGLISFQPEQLHTTSKTAPIFLTGFQIDNTEINDKKEDSKLIRSILYTNQVTLNHNQSSFSIDFAALNYNSPETTAYAYKMSGLYNNWSYLKSNRKVYFTKITPGDYVFEVKSMISGSKEWSKNNIKLRITVLPPVWKTTFAYLCYTLIILAFITILILRYRKKMKINNKRRMEIFEHKKEKEIYQAKIEFFTNIAHEIRTPLTLIKGPMEKLIKYAKEVPPIEKNLKIMNRNTERLLALTNQLLDFRKTEIKGFSLNFVKANVSDLLQDVALQFHDAAEQNNISYETILPAEKLFAYVDAEAFYKIISNLVDNAIKYSKLHVKVILSINESQDQFSIRIINDGRKIASELKDKIFVPFFRAKEAEITQGTGIGLSISRSLTELHKGHLYLEKSDSDNNVFVASFPIHQIMEFNLKGKWKKI